MADTNGKLKTIREKLAGKTPHEQATIKGLEIAEKVSAFQREKRGDFDIEVLSVTAIERGVEVLARVWDANGEQVGFGKDGTVDIERFRFINPPVIVKDPDGDIINDYTDKDGNTVISRGKEDVREAILRRLEAALHVKKEKFSSEKISRGKIGSTTTIIDYTAGTGAAGGSSHANVDGAGSYAAARDAATAGAVDNIAGNSAFNVLHNSRGGSGDYYVRRGDIQFDTSSIPDGDAVSAASVTFYIHATNGQNVDGDTVVLLDNTNNGNLADPLATEDFNDFTSTSIGSRVLSELIDVGANRSIDLTTFGAINKTGNTRIGLRLLNDINNTSPSGANAWNVFSIATGTSGDNPFITIEHAPSVIEATYTEAVGMNDTVLRSTSRTLDDAIGLNDSIIRSISRTLSDLIGAADTFLGEKVIPVVFTELINLNDTITRQITAVRTELMNTADTITTAWTAARTFTENISLNDTFERVWTRIVTLTETIGMNDTIQKLLNGSAVIWGRVARNVASWRRIDRDNP